LQKCLLIVLGKRKQNTVSARTKIETSLPQKRRPISVVNKKSKSLG